MLERQRQGIVEIVRTDTPIKSGELDDIQNVMNQLHDAGQPSVVLDLRKVPLIDSSGLELLLDTNDRFRAQGGHLKLVAPNSLVAEILSVTGVERFMEIFPDDVAAVGSFTR